MGKNKARHILHGILDLLPVLIIPIFAININQKSVEPISITTDEYIYTNVYRTNTVESTDDYVEGNIYHYKRLVSSIPTNTTTYLIYASFINFQETDFELDANSIGTTYLTFRRNTNNTFYIYKVNGSQQATIFNYSTDLMGDYVEFDFVYIDKNFLPPIEYVTQSTYNKATYQYVEGVVYDDTDVGSQMIYTLYNAVDKYFNMGNVFGMQNLYDWFLTNIFGGHFSLSIYIVWNIVLYEFVMDLLFLLYGLFMFFIDMCKRLMEKPLNSIK